MFNQCNYNDNRLISFLFFVSGIEVAEKIFLPVIFRKKKGNWKKNYCLTNVLRKISVKQSVN